MQNSIYSSSSTVSRYDYNNSNYIVSCEESQLRSLLRLVKRVASDVIARSMSRHVITIDVSSIKMFNIYINLEQTELNRKLQAISELSN